MSGLRISLPAIRPDKLPSFNKGAVHQAFPFPQLAMPKERSNKPQLRSNNAWSIILYFGGCAVSCPWGSAVIQPTNKKRQEPTRIEKH